MLTWWMPWTCTKPKRRRPRLRFAFHGREGHVQEQRRDVRGLPRGRRRPRGRRDPGVVGTRARTSRTWPTGSPPRASPRSRPTCTTASRATEPDGAGKLMMALNLQTAAKDLSGAVDLLLERTGRPAVGVVGFCMGGGLALVLATPATRRGEGRGARTTASSRGRRRSRTGRSSTRRWSVSTPRRTTSPTPTRCTRSRRSSAASARTSTLHIHPGADHAFFNDTRPEVYDAERVAERLRPHRRAVPHDAVR